jgi:hypothetical protein
VGRAGAAPWAALRLTCGWTRCAVTPPHDGEESICACWLDHLPASVAFGDAETTGRGNHDRTVCFGGIGMINRDLANARTALTCCIRPQVHQPRDEIVRACPRSPGGLPHHQIVSGSGDSTRARRRSASCGAGPAIPIEFAIDADRWKGRRQRARRVVPENLVPSDSRDERESEHDPTRCLPSSICLERLSPTCSSRGAGLRLRTCFSGISSILL